MNVRRPLLRPRPAPALPLATTACAVALIVATCGVSLAGTVEVVVRDENGAPVINERVTLHAPFTDGGPQVRFGGELIPIGTTDSKGIALFDGLSPGRYTATIRPRTVGLIPPTENPLHPVPEVTLESEQDHARLAVELWHGTPVVARVAVHRGRLQKARLFLREIDHGLSLEHSLNVDTDSERILAPGRWELTLDPPHGYLLTGLEIDGRPVAGHVAPVELDSFGSPSFVTWHVTAPSAITGRVYFEGPRTGVVVVARLLDPGPWIEEVSRRGGSRFEVVEASPDITDEYAIELPDGRWELTVVGDEVVSVEPERAELAVPPGGEIRQDFNVRAEKKERGGMLRVRVEDPEGRRVSGATVEVWPEDPAQRGEQPVAREHTDSWGAFLRDIPAGSYVIAAGHPRFVEGEFALTDYDPEAKRPVRPVVVLRRAGTLHAVATDNEDRAVEGVRLHMIRVDAKPAMLIAEESLVAAASEAHGETDATGHGWIEGIWPGRYELRGDLSGRGGSGSFVRFVDGGETRETTEVTILAGEERQSEVRILPAAGYAARLVCRDEFPLPGSVSFVALPASVDPVELEDANWMKHAVLRVDDVPLTGRLRERLVAGPLEDDAYFLAVRPTGHERWTWAMGTERLSDAALIRAGQGEPSELGTLQLHCGPAVRLDPVVGDGRELPDLESVIPSRGRLTLSGTVAADGARRSIERFEVDAYPDQLILRGLPEGDAELEVSLTHPCFLPPVIRVPIDATLERGKTEPVTFLIPSIGGVIRVETDRGSAGRLTALDEEPRLEPADQGRIVFENLPPGFYRVELCDDAGCARILRTWDVVEVTPLRTIELQDPATTGPDF